MLQKFSHWTPRYILDRLLVFIHEKRFPDQPWLTRDAVHFLEKVIKPSDIGVEFGSGRSTGWFATRLHKLISVEHDEVWFSKVSDSLRRSGTSHRVDYRLCTDEKEYAEQIALLPNESVDICLVDGKVRDICALAMVPKLRRGGLLIVDNINWYMPSDSRSPSSRRSNQGFSTAVWEEFRQQVTSWRCYWTSDGVNDTAIWFVP